MTEDISAAPLLARDQVDSDERKLRALGYAQQLQRRMNEFSGAPTLACSSQNVLRGLNIRRSG